MHANTKYLRNSSIKQLTIKYIQLNSYWYAYVGCTLLNVKYVKEPPSIQVLEMIIKGSPGRL